MTATLHDGLTRAEVNAEGGQEHAAVEAKPRTNVGLLWFDKSARPLAEKLAKAKAHYAKKYGATPTHACVSLAEDPPAECAGMTVTASRTVIRGHYFIGRD